MNSFIQKLLKKETVVQSASFILILTIIEKVTQLIRGVIFARVLGPTEYGVYTLAFFFVPLIVSVAKLGLPSCYERYVARYEMRGELGEFLKRNYVLTISAAITLTVLLLSSTQQISQILYTTAKYKNVIILCALTILPYVLYENFVASFNGLRVFKMSALLRFSQFFVFTSLGIILVVFYPHAESTVLANLVSLILVSGGFGFMVWKYILNSNFQDSKIQEVNFYSKMFKYSIWFIIFPLVSALFHYTDRLMLNHFLGLHEVGVYSVAINITQMIFMIGMITGNILMPNLSNLWERGEKDRVMFILNLAIKFTTLSILGYAVIFVIFKKQIMVILYGTKYLEGLSVIPIFLIFWLFNTIVWIVGVYPNLIEKPYLPIIAIVSGFALNIVLNYILIPVYGITGAAIAIVISYFSIVVILFFLYKKEKLELNLKTIFVCLTPFILFFNNIPMIVASLILFVITLRSNFIMTEEEKFGLVQQIKKMYK